jgi:CheY-like chemotaxis protein/HPt (histidine-containing phosphotransfer) domain-containing protein
LIKPVKQSELLDAILSVLSLPHLEEHADTRLITRHSLREKRSEKNQVSNPSFHILLAEDNPINQKVAGLMLEELGHRLVMVNNGREALEAWKQRSFDLILMDVQMPEMDGFETTASIRAKEWKTGKHIPIIALTANALKGDQELCLLKGMDGHLAKPVTLDRLIDVIGEAMGKRQDVKAPRLEYLPEEVIFDKDLALGCYGGKMQVLKMVAAMFLQECHDQMSGIRAAIDQKDGAQLRMAAHRFKGSVAQLGSPAAEASALRLETQGKMSDFSQVEENWNNLVEKVDRLKDALQVL